MIADERPFYLGSHQSLSSNDFVASGAEEAFGHEHDGPDDSENDDLRSVIDDLTVENKRLKLLLKSQRAQPGASSHAPDRLFELRVQGLPADKKRELEQLLQSFAINVNASSASVSYSSATNG